jgi:hypothetical protein
VPLFPIKNYNVVGSFWSAMPAALRQMTALIPGHSRLTWSRATYVENGDFGGTLDVSILSSSFLAFLAAFFAFLPAFRTSFVFLDIRRSPPMASMQRGPLSV